jgi:hypothetical protein
MIEMTTFINLNEITPDVKCMLFKDNVEAEMLAKSQR